MLTIFLFILGFILLIKGADFLVEGASSIAKKFNISSLVIGLTIVAFGTSAPELIVSALASFKGNEGIALGNIIGSNISNSLLILGIAAIIAPLVVKRNTINKEIPFSLLAVLVVGLLVNDNLFNGATINSLSRVDGLILILFFIIFIYYTFGISKIEKGIIGDKKEEEIKTYNFFVSGGMILLGILGLFFGGEWIVEGAIFIAENFGLSESLIGLTIVAVGTSLPELAASGVAAYRGNSDMAVGNVVGSNIFNLLWVLGISSVIRPIKYDVALNLDIVFLFAITILLLFLIYLGRKGSFGLIKKNVLGRGEGVSLIFLYICYILFLIYTK